jgi:hypothetical protein
MDNKSRRPATQDEIDKVNNFLTESKLKIYELVEYSRVSKAACHSFRHGKGCEKVNREKLLKFVNDHTGKSRNEIQSEYEKPSASTSNSLQTTKKENDTGAKSTLNPEYSDIRVEQEKLVLLKNIGIDFVIPEAQLSESQYSHRNCLESKIKTNLWIAGVLANKWTDKVHRELFEKCLFRLQKKEVRFLLIHPESNIYKRLNRENSMINNSHSLNELRKLMDEHKNLKVKLTKDQPNNRLMFINGSTLIFSRYYLGESPSSSDYLVIKSDPNTPTPVYHFFENFYENLWNSESNNIEKLENVDLPNDFETND